MPVITDDELRRLPHGTLILIGEDESLYDVKSSAARVRALAPQVVLRLVPRAGHMLTLNRADVVNEALVALCCQTTGPDGGARGTL